MKFGKRLQRLLDDSLPEWRDKFIAYKRLKKSLKVILPDELIYGDHHPAAGSSSSSSSSSQLCLLNDLLITPREAEFIALLNQEIEKMNSFFLEKEEEFVIRLQEVKGKLVHRLRLEKAAENFHHNNGLTLEMVEIRKAIVNIHGEMVLLENYSALNYTGLVKIIKKHDKRTGGVNLRMPFIQSVLQQPFFATEIISRLVLECEEMLMQQPCLSFSLSNINNYNNINLQQQQHNQQQQQQQQPWIPVQLDHAGSIAEYNVFMNPALNYIEAAVAAAVDVDDGVDRICRNIMAAWRIMKEFRKGSSTYNFFSIPPFDYSNPAMEDQAAAAATQAKPVATPTLVC